MCVAANSTSLSTSSGMSFAHRLQGPRNATATPWTGCMGSLAMCVLIDLHTSHNSTNRGRYRLHCPFGENWLTGKSSDTALSTHSISARRDCAGRDLVCTDIAAYSGCMYPTASQHPTSNDGCPIYRGGVMLFVVEILSLVRSKKIRMLPTAVSGRELSSDVVSAPSSTGALCDTRRSSLLALGAGSCIGRITAAGV